MARRFFELSFFDRQVFVVVAGVGEVAVAVVIVVVAVPAAVVVVAVLGLYCDICVSWLELILGASNSLLSICFCTPRLQIHMPQFHVYQSPDFLGSETVEENHWQTGNLVFELLKEFLRYRTSNSIPPEVRGCINVHDSQVIHETGMQREAVDNLQHCGKCLLHATCGVLLEHWKMIRIAQKAQAVTNGYFGGYIGKAQPAGHMEIKKCIDKMYTLRDSLAKDRKSFRQQQRAVSGRMVTDLEMNGVFRGAVEQFNLASNLRRNDVLFPECIRTFATRSLDTQTFFHRLRIALQREVSLQYTVYIPPTKQPRAKSKNVKPQHVDIYGYRPLQNTPFELLSVFEFYMYFYVEALLFPDACTTTIRTEWTQLGLLLWKEYVDQKRLHAQPQMPQWAPGKHYTVIEPANDEYYTFPSEPARTYEVFRHRWVIVRNRRPHVRHAWNRDAQSRVQHYTDAMNVSRRLEDNAFKNRNYAISSITQKEIVSFAQPVSVRGRNV
jgi:hypothetical protein